MNWKNNIIVATLVFIVTLFTLKSAVLMSYYILFTDDFIENFCVNKDQPELNCDGKCFLSKMLNKSDQHEGRQETIAISLAQLEFIFTPLENADLLLLINVTKNSLALNVVAEQDDLATSFGESSATPGYELLDFKVSYDLMEDLNVGAGVLNIFDVDYYDHLNFAFRNQADNDLSASNRLTNPGRNVSFFAKYTL